MNHLAIYKAAKDKFGVLEASIRSTETEFILVSNSGDEYTNADFTQAELDAAENALKAESEALIAEMESKKNALLEKLGITIEEAKLLLS